MKEERVTITIKNVSHELSFRELEELKDRVDHEFDQKFPMAIMVTENMFWEYPKA